MTFAYFLVVTVHVLAAMLWLGGTFFLAIVGAPVLRGVQPPELRAALFRGLGERFRLAGWISIGVLLATGVAMLALRGMLQSSVLLNPEFWTAGFGLALAWKLGAVVVIVGLSLVHDFVIGPAASSDPSLRTRAAWLARAGALVGVVLLVAAVRLARGG